MARRLFRARVGTQRIAKSLRPSQAAYTRTIRKQMEQLERNLSKVMAELDDVTSQVLETALRPTFNKSQKFTPKDTGALRESGFLTVDKVARGTRIQIGYGKAGKPPYAVFVHERTDLNHQAPTKAKFLQTALEEDSDVIPQRLLKAYKEAIDI